MEGIVSAPERDAERIPKSGDSAVYFGRFHALAKRGGLVIQPPGSAGLDLDANILDHGDRR